ncbi:MAG: hypothetical protein ACRDQ1_07995, partial [Sciscionella sp.]
DFQAITAKAPSDIKPQWTTLDNAVAGLNKALKDANLNFGDLAKLAQGKIPAGFNASKVKEVSTAAQALSTAKVTAAGTAVQNNVNTVCHISLKSGS